MVLKRIGGAALAVVAIICGLLAYGALKNLWASYRDSPTFTYVVAGGAWTLLALLVLALAVRLIRRSP